LLSVTDGNVLGSARAPIAQPISSVWQTAVNVVYWNCELWSDRLHTTSKSYGL